MSTLFFEEKKCFHCRKEGTFPKMDHTITIVGPKDLDGRPSHTQRSAVYIWIQRCFACGYCAQDIAQGNSKDKAIIDSAEYQSLLTCTDYPDTAKAYLARILLMRNKGLYADAGWDALFASWICDDNGFNKSARTCRLDAIAFFTEARTRNLQFAETSIDENMFLIDLYRRTGQFDKAANLCTHELKKDDLEERAWSVLLYEKELIGAGDDSCHNDIDAEEYDG